jgi:hypothetical protein
MSSFDAKAFVEKAIADSRRPGAPIAARLKLPVWGCSVLAVICRQAFAKFGATDPAFGERCADTAVLLETAAAKGPDDPHKAVFVVLDKQIAGDLIHMVLEHKHNMQVAAKSWRPKTPEFAALSFLHARLGAFHDRLDWPTEAEMAAAREHGLDRWGRLKHPPGDGATVPGKKSVSAA